MRTYSVDEFCWADPDMQLTGVTVVEVRTRLRRLQQYPLLAGALLH
jgi:hypothetical protein